jgi:outer membrane protein assembly factor BamE (lipoprotein component of BamABCDE complex)
VLAEQLEGIRAIQPGMAQDKVKQTLGAPLTQTTGQRGQEWDYNFKLRQAQSGNLLVCQYKVVFDEAGAVRESPGAAGNASN